MTSPKVTALHCRLVVARSRDKKLGCLPGTQIVLTDAWREKEHQIFLQFSSLQKGRLPHPEGEAHPTTLQHVH
eukprot:1794214-Amphidinium_carterae.1